MTDLTGKQIANTYKQLLKVAVSTNAGVCATLQTIQSGDGTNSAMQLSNTAIRSTGALDAGGDVSVGGAIFTEGNVCATAFFGSGAHLTSVSAALFSTSIDSFTANRLHVVTAASIAVLEVQTCASITNLVAPTGSFTTKVSGVAAEFSGIVSALTFDGALTGDVTGDIDGATGSFSACISSTNLVAATGSFTTKVSGVAAEFSGNVCASEYYGDGSNLTNVSAASFATSVAAMTINTLGVVTAASITSLVAPFGSFTTKVSGVAAEFSGIVSALTFDGALTGDVTGDLSGNVTGDIDGATGSFSACVSTTNLVAATGSFTTKVSGVAAEFSGIVSALTFDGALTGDVTGDLSGNVTGDIDGATGSFSACISSTNLVAATGSFTTKVSGVAAEFSGNVCAVEYYGDGSNLTNLPSQSTSVASFTVNQLGVVTAASITSLVAPHGSFTTKVSGVAAEFSGNVCASEYYGDGSNLTGITVGTSAATYTINRLHVVSAVSITGTASIAGGLWADGGAVFNDAGADVDFTVESASISDILKVDSGDDTTRIKGFIYEQQVISASVSSGTHVIDLSKANIYDLTFLNDCSLSFSNVAPSGRAQDFTMIIRRTAVASVSFDPIVLTAGGVTLGLADTSGRTDVLTMFTVDGGTSFFTASSFLNATTVAA
jgi:hypothetical protein